MRLAELLAPLPVAEFVDRWFERRPLHLRAGEERASRFAPLFDRESFFRALPHAYPVRADFSTDETRRRRRPVEIRAEQAEGLFAAGATICVSHIERGDRRLAELAARVKSELGYAGAVYVNAYLSPDRSGAPTHLDARVATTLQIEGRKRWRFSREPALPFPRANAVLDGDDRVRHQRAPELAAEGWEAIEAPDESAFDEAVLAPGDVLCLPPGTWHSAKAIGVSLALNLAFEPLGFLELLERAIAPALRPNPAWRRPPPPAPTSLARPDGRLPEPVARFFGARIAELRALLDRLDPEGDALAHAWHHAVFPGLGAHAAEDEAGDPDPLPIAPDDTLVLRWPMRWGFAPADEGERRLMLYHALTGATPLPEAALPFVAELARRERFVAREATTWPGPGGRCYDWDEVRGAFELLRARQLLEIAC